MEDLYSILGVNKTASQDEIKKSYRNMAFKYHPDRNAGNKEAEEKFKKINEAYSVLGDESKRKQYDMYGNSGTNSYSQQDYQNQRTYTYYSNDDFFNDFFNNYQKNSYQRNSYTYTSRNTDSKQYLWKKIKNGAIKLVISFFLLRIMPFFFPINIICFVACVNGITDIVSSGIALVKGRKDNK